MANKKLTELPAISTVSSTTIFLVDDTGTTQTANGTVIKSYITSTDMTLSGNLLPNIGSTYTLGSPTKKWADLYMGPNSIRMEDTANSANVGVLTVTNGILQINGTTGLQANLVSGSTTLTLAPSGNINLSVNSTSNVLQVTSSSAIVNGDLTVTGNVNITGNVNALNYGIFANTANLTASANTATAILFDTSIANLGITKGTGTSNSRIIVNKAGTYNVKAQLGIYQNGAGTVTLNTWVKKNGNDVAYSQNSLILNNNPTGALLVNDCVVPSLAVNDYIEIYWALVGTGPDVGHIKLVAQAAQTTPFIMPASPSAVVTVTPIA